MPTDARSLLAEQSGIVFGTGFGVVTDIQSGPGGLYVTSLTQGSLFRITDNTVAVVEPVPEPTVVATVALLLAGAARRGRPHGAVIAESLASRSSFFERRETRRKRRG